jgi:phage contractile tail tube protein, P2 family
MLLFNEGRAYLGEVSEIVLPKLSRKMEEWKGGGMSRPVKLDMGGDLLEFEATFGGPMFDIISQYGAKSLTGVYMRFVGSWQNDDAGTADVVEVIVRGRFEEIDFGNAKPGEKSDFKIKMPLAYYRLDCNGTTLIEIDPINMVEIVDGVDLLEAQRTALGLF